MIEVVASTIQAWLCFYASVVPAVPLKHGIGLPLLLAFGVFPSFARRNNFVTGVNNGLSITAPGQARFRHHVRHLSFSPMLGDGQITPVTSCVALRRAATAEPSRFCGTCSVVV